MSGRITVLKGENMTLGTGNVLAAFQTAAGVSGLGANVRVKRLEISQSGSTTLAMIRGEMATRDTVGTLTTTAATPQALRPTSGPGSGFTGNTNVLGGGARSGINSSADSGGTYTQLWPFAFANTSGYLWKPDPDEEIWLAFGNVFAVRLLAAPATLTGWNVALVLAEE